MDGTVFVADDDRIDPHRADAGVDAGGVQGHATSSLVTLMRWVEEGKGDLVISMCDARWQWS